MQTVYGEAQRRGMTALGYQDYFVTTLGIWKVLGEATTLIPARN